MTMVNLSLEGKVAVVTGGSKGIGRAIALAFAEYGADVAIAARGAEALDRTRKEIEDHGRGALAVQTDVANAPDLERLYAEVCEAFGGVDVLVNNAATGDEGRELAKLTRDEFDRVLSVNLWAAIRLSQLCRPSMQQRDGGTILNIVSNPQKVKWLTIGSQMVPDGSKDFLIAPPVPSHPSLRQGSLPAC